MENLQSFILVIHIFVCIVLILLVLLQAGKEGMGVIFGGGSGTLFGSTGAGGLLVKLTAVMATLFLITSLTYSYLTKRPSGQESEVMGYEEQLDDVEQPVIDVAAPAETETPADTPDVTADVSAETESPAADAPADTPADAPAEEETN